MSVKSTAQAHINYELIGEPRPEVVLIEFMNADIIDPGHAASWESSWARWSGMICRVRSSSTSRTSGRWGVPPSGKLPPSPAGCGSGMGRYESATCATRCGSAPP